MCRAALPLPHVRGAAAEVAQRRAWGEQEILRLSRSGGEQMVGVSMKMPELRPMGPQAIVSVPDPYVLAVTREDLFS